MARAKVNDIRAALVRMLQTVAPPVNAYPTIPTNWEMNPIAIAVGEFESERVSMDGMRNYTWDLVVRARTTDKDLGQTVIGDYLSAGGPIDTALSTDPSLGGVVDFAWFVEVGAGMGMVGNENGGTPALQGIVKVRMFN